MELLYKNLQTNELVGNSFIKHLKEYINVKYPDYDSEKTAKIFADAVNKAVDKHISHFDEEHRQDIRENLLKNSMQDDKLRITAADIFEISVLSGIKTENFLECVTKWVNEVQEVQLSSDMLEEVISVVEKNKGKEINFEEMLLNIHEDAASYLDKQEEIEINDMPFISEIEMTAKKQNYISEKIIPMFLRHKAMALILAGIMLFAGINVFMLVGRTVSNIEESLIEKKVDKSPEIESAKVYMKVTVRDKKFIDENKLAPEFRYGTIDEQGLKQFLTDRGALLGREPYFSVILNMGKKYNVSPLLMMAITGQEQNFVPASLDNAKRIANNPFNVYGSWQKYNTNIVEAAEIAARTIIDLSKDKPSGYDTIKWINRRYAEDKNWHKGVTEFFQQFRRTYAAY